MFFKILLHEVGRGAGWDSGTGLCASRQEFVYRYKQDGLIKVAIKGRKGVADFFTQYDSPKEKLDEILELVTKEVEGTEAEDKDASNVGGLDPAPSAAHDDDPDCAAQQHIRTAFRAADDNMDEETADSWYAQVKQKYGSLIKLISQEDVSESALAELIQGARFSYFRKFLNMFKHIYEIIASRRHQSGPSCFAIYSTCAGQ